MGIEWGRRPDVDGPHAPYFQSQRSQRYTDAVAELLDKGLAYRDYGSAEEWKELRETAERAKQPFVTIDDGPPRRRRMQPASSPRGGRPPSA